MTDRLKDAAGWFVLLVLTAHVMQASPVHRQEQEDRPVRLNRIPALAFAGKSSAWLVSEDQKKVLFTSDGGSHWNETTNDFGQVSCLDFIDPRNGWLVAVDENPAHLFRTTASVFRTTDGGVSWKRISRPASTHLMVWQIKLTDQLHGWLVALDSVWRSQDGGLTWQNVSPAALRGSPVKGAFLGSDAWICTAGGMVFRTSDGGESWRSQTVNPQLDFVDIVFTDSKNGWLQTPLSNAYMGVLYRTSNGGETWHLEPRLENDLSLTSVSFINEHEGWGVGQSVIAHTFAAGSSWQLSSFDMKDWIFWTVHFSDSEHGWIVGSDNLYYTKNAGREWNPTLDLRRLSSGRESLSHRD
ncbi:MAG TPA: YCF48-related protein [Pyrinomonadaceae bacterium]|nr:YCF48-related protein [Pyrinomonadaceae bacterium]